ncbi:MFS transporter [Nocardioides marmoribigeumensis]|uniref:EmrB/QacA subfamily drug resistance transporter n=1 Tax=Nocardioides marmoribigeumensis TaxID=433649 RepID=A0ABU2BQJ8_9ACTN|nr:MFS transporter [Nocardioides marmoribigeumensis]MDR7360909.1 EmrB/QacA subfamily drug resistance transporter [Nocardioides marmoribigeumensis]
MSSTLVPRARTAAAPGAPERVDRRDPALGTAIVLVAQLMLILDAAVMNVALPQIGHDLDFSPAGLSWVLNGYGLAFGGLLLLGGRLGDVLGRLRVFWTGVAVFTFFSLLGGFATTAWELVAARVLQGAGAALAAPSVLALLTTSAKDATARNRALALFAAVSSGGATLGLLLGGVVTDLGSWRWTLFINVPFGLAVLLTVRRHVVETERRPGRFDVIGAVASTGAAVSVVWALIGAPEHGWDSLRTVGGLALGVVLLAVLVVTEAKVAHPLLQLSLFRSRHRVAGLLTMATLVAAQFPLFFLGVQYLEVQLGYGPVATGLAFLPVSLGIFTMSRITPRLVARFGTAPLMVLGTTGVGLSSLWLTQLPAGGSYAATVFLPFLLNGLSAGLTFMPTTLTVLADVEPVHAGSASGLLQTMQQLGGAVGVAVVASVYAAHHAPGAAFVSGTSAAFTVSALTATLAVAAALTLLLRRTPAVPERSPHLR